MPLPSAQTTVAAAAGILTAGAYLNAKLGIGYDLRVLRHQGGTKARLVESYQKLGNDLSLYRLLEIADQDADAIWFEGKTLTYREFKEVVDALALYLLHHGIISGQVVGILSTNSPEMCILMFAISKIGGVSALLNTALKSDALIHCIGIAKTDVIFASPDLVANVPTSIRSTPLKIYSLNLGYLGPFYSQRNLESPFMIIEPQDIDNLPSPPPLQPGTQTDTCLLIFTSGTTGKPKAVQIPKLYLPGFATKPPLDLNNPSKYFPIRTYSCLPLFHATALSGFLTMIGTSGCFCISRKFSASNFSRELYESKATRVCYVGEICRYLLAAPPSEYDKKTQLHRSNRQRPPRRRLATLSRTFQHP